MKLNNPNKFQYWPHDGFLQWFNKRDLAVAILFNGSKTRTDRCTETLDCAVPGSYLWLFLHYMIRFNPQQ